MKTIKKNVYYCDYCKKKSLSASHLSKHETHCTNNPNRKCRMCSGKYNIGEIVEEYKKRFTITEYTPQSILEIGHTDTHVVEWIGEKINLEEVRNKVDGCPNCMLAIIRQCKFGHHYFHDFGKFNYKSEMEDAMRVINDKNKYDYSEYY